MTFLCKFVCNYQIFEIINFFIDFCIYYFILLKKCCCFIRTMLKTILFGGLFIWGAYFGIKNKDKISQYIKINSSEVVGKKPRVDLSDGSFSR